MFLTALLRSKAVKNLLTGVVKNEMLIEEVESILASLPVVSSRRLCAVGGVLSNPIWELADTRNSS